MSQSAQIVTIMERQILLIRGEKVILDADLAKLYGVETKVLVQAVKRNKDRFPSDFMFQLSQVEFSDLRSQFVTSTWGVVGIRLTPLQNKALQCSPACFAAHELSLLTLKSCELSLSFDACWTVTINLGKN